MIKKRFITLAPFLICFFFFIAYSLLSLIRHAHFGSFGFDLGIVDQIVWKYSQFKAPITTIQFYPFTSLLTDHVELIYILLTPFYWIYNSPYTLLLLQTLFITFSGIPVYFLARRRNISIPLSLSLLIGYLSFYGIQNAIWFDVHSIIFGVSFLPWFVYLFETKKSHLAFIPFFLSIISKEDVALLTFLISIVLFITTRKKLSLIFAALSVLYLIVLFVVYFPHFTQDGYRYDNTGGLFADVHLNYLYDSPEKRDVYVYSFGWFGFLSLLSPLFLIPALGEIAHYFIFGNNISAAQGLFMHYRASLAFLLVWPCIETIKRFKKLNSLVIACVILLIVSLLQYKLHVPLTYLSKAWFWQEPESVKNIRESISHLPKDASVVAQNNIVPHIAHRDEVFTLWPEQKKQNETVHCNNEMCSWFRWSGNPKYLLVDTASTWDARHLLTNRDEFIQGIKNLENNKFIKKNYEKGTVVLYIIEKNPNN